MTAPTLYLCHARARRGQGPGRRWSIEARPDFRVRGAGRIHALRPPWPWVARFAEDRIPVQDFRAAYQDMVTGLLAEDYRPHAARCALVPSLVLWGSWRRYLTAERALGPGELVAESWCDCTHLVEDGDTLWTSEKWGAEGVRKWAAEVLACSGWRVVLDGREVRIPTSRMEAM